VIETLLEWIGGQLSPSARVWTAAAPALLLLGAVVAGMGVFAVRNAVRGPYRDPDVERRGSSWLLNMWVRRYFSWLMRPLLSLVLTTRLPPAAITTLSLLLATGAAVAMAAGRMALGGWLFVTAGICDFMDGRIARERETAGPSGALLDSVIDRYVDGAVFMGLAWFYRDSWTLAVVLLALLGTMLVPYVRARGEALGVEFPNIGLAQRPERVAILGLSVALSPIVEAIAVPDDPRPLHRLAVVGIVLVAATSHLTALQRLFHARRWLATEPPQSRKYVGPGSVLRNMVAAGLATGCDFAVVVALVSLAGLSPPVGTFLGCIVGATVNFVTNRVWTYQSQAPPVGQGGRYLIVSASSAFLNSGLVAVLLLLPAVPYPLAWWLVRALVFLSWNHPLYRDYVFAAPAAVSTSPEEPASESSRA
jgi:phosphatidylglycerophosphate synthase/putative flippase GtrA